jgi:hypothetical protein
MTLAQKTLLARSKAMGIMEKSDKASVMMPIVIPPVLSVTQQQHRFKHGIAIVALIQKQTSHSKTSPFFDSFSSQMEEALLVARESTSLSKDCSPMAATAAQTVGASLPHSPSNPRS